MTWKPAGYTSLSPYLIVDDAEATLAFAEAAFGAERLREFRNDSGAIVHAELRVDDTVLMVGQMPGGPDATLHLYVPDPDATVTRALDAGATLAEAVRDHADGDRRGGVRDPNGPTWFLGRAGEPAE
jgi:uncharacterized glyoxalase superfamily protein PhnB